jgi:uncharacterized protein (DUF305 family)
MSAPLLTWGQRWRAAALFGLISSTYSTLVSQLTAGRLGRDALVDWMIVGSIALRENGLQMAPSWWNVLAGLLVHQSADFGWDIVFFFILSRWSHQLGPWMLLAIAVPWAVFTSGVEWLFLVPVIPFWWPVFTLEQAWWLGLLVHTTAASTFPFFPYIRDRFAGIKHSPHKRFTAIYAGLAVIGVSILAVLALAGEQGRELPHIGRNIAFDQQYMINMSAHHRQGIELATLATERASDPRLRAIARMMVATQESEIRIFEKWWRSWFEGELPDPAPEQHGNMPGMLTPAELGEVAQAYGADFDQRFIAAMSTHHGGAIAMADQAMKQAGDPRLQIMSHGIRHQQQGDINLMHGLDGIAAVQAASRAMFFTDAAPQAPGPAMEQAH